VKCVAFTIVASLMLLGCAPGGILTDGGEETSGEVGDGDGDGDDVSVWAEIRCVESIADICYGRLNTADDAWTIVVESCLLDELIDSGKAAPVDAWTAESCRAGEHPSGLLPEWRCLTIFDRGTSVCYAGDGAWWTQVAPSCEIGPGTVSAWSEYQCEGAAGQVSTHPWDSIGCFDGQSATCVAVSGEDSMLVWPTCHVDQFAQAEAPACKGDLGEPCPCGADLVCVDGLCTEPLFEAGQLWGPCPTDQQSGQPTLCYGEDLACVPADFGESNICLPLGSCPPTLPDIGTTYEIGWGDACYPRCSDDADCAPGMVCGMAIADSTPMCAWPVG
jgi:hypothetical protein